MISNKSFGVNRFLVKVVYCLSDLDMKKKDVEEETYVEVKGYKLFEK